ncbi:porin [Pandoraea terrae]|uniref:Porin n=1 Tax=Pandoraea terrae TaxID=1537710 RepID=A0A5E4VHH1_9BURK|nr:porin [Pandoraea terrae]VVE10465.1 porin [Pandoraea terrae]
MVFGSTPEHAHDGVTIYGLISTGFNYVGNQNGQPLFSAMSGTMQAPRFGVKGREELGDGTAAIFRQENGFNVLTGGTSQRGRMFMQRVRPSGDVW